VDTAKLRGEIERYLGDFKAEGFSGRQTGGAPQKEVRVPLPEIAIPERQGSIAFHIPSMKVHDVNARDLAGDILGSRESSRLVRVLKKEKALVNSISAYALTPKEPGIMVVSATLDAKNLEAVTQGIMEGIAGLARSPFAEELERAKVHIESASVEKRFVARARQLRADMGRQL
jgi:zinc protease